MSDINDVDKIESTAEKNVGLSYIKNFIIDILDLRKGVDKLAAIDEIKRKKSMSGANAWMLMCSIIIASIGLDRDSDAVIIGAMLISPLMSPILGIGLGIGINDKDVIKKAAIHFSAAIFIALVTSFIYFKLSPFGRITPAILARTAPDTLDVFIAIFGGLAGIISIARKDISTTLPGVAIATALMPPLCVTGFGLAEGNWTYALNSFYLFLLNTSFISIATYVIVRYLRFPYRRYVNPKERYRNRIVVIIYAFLIIIPSFIILGNVLQKTNTQNTIKEFAETCFGDDQIYFDSYTTIETDTSKIIVMKVYGEQINVDKLPTYNAKLKKMGLEDWKIKILQSSEVNVDEIHSLENQINEVRVFTEQESAIRRREKAQREAAVSDSVKILRLEGLLTKLDASVEEISFSEMHVASSKGYSVIPTCIIRTKNKDAFNKNSLKTFQDVIAYDLQLDTIRFIVE